MSSALIVLSTRLVSQTMVSHPHQRLHARVFQGCSDSAFPPEKYQQPPRLDPKSTQPPAESPSTWLADCPAFCSFSHEYYQQ